MSMSHPDHPEPPASTIHGELRGKIISPPMPPMPPMPPPGAGIELLRDTVEVQARTIRYLLANYEALLRKVEAEEPEPVIVPAVQPSAPIAEGTLWNDAGHLKMWHNNGWHSIGGG